MAGAQLINIRIRESMIFTANFYKMCRFTYNIIIIVVVIIITVDTIILLLYLLKIEWI